MESYTTNSVMSTCTTVASVYFLVWAAILMQLKGKGQLPLRRKYESGVAGGPSDNIVHGHQFRRRSQPLPTAINSGRVLGRSSATVSRPDEDVEHHQYP